MSRTYKRYPYSCFRHPSGKCRALRSGVKRKKAIPPDAWDDVHIDKQAFLPETVAQGLWENCYSREEIVRHLRKKFKISLREAERIVRFTFHYNDYEPDGVLRVGKNERSNFSNGLCEERDISGGGDTE